MLSEAPILSRRRLKVHCRYYRGSWTHTLHQHWTVSQLGIRLVWLQGLKSNSSGNFSRWFWSTSVSSIKNVKVIYKNFFSPFFSVCIDFQRKLKDADNFVLFYCWHVLPVTTHRHLNRESANSERICSPQEQKTKKVVWKRTNGWTERQ